MNIKFKYKKYKNDKILFFILKFDIIIINIKCMNYCLIKHVYTRKDKNCIIYIKHIFIIKFTIHPKKFSTLIISFEIYFSYLFMYLFSKFLLCAQNVFECFNIYLWKKICYYKIHIYYLVFWFQIKIVIQTNLNLLH